MLAQPGDRLPCLGLDLAPQRLVLRVRRTREQEVLPDKDSQLVADVVEVFALVDAAAPDAQQVHAGVDRVAGCWCGRSPASAGSRTRRRGSSWRPGRRSACRSPTARTACRRCPGQRSASTVRNPTRPFHVDRRSSTVTVTSYSGCSPCPRGHHRSTAATVEVSSTVSVGRAATVAGLRRAADLDGDRRVAALAVGPRERDVGGQDTAGRRRPAPADGPSRSARRTTTRSGSAARCPRSRRPVPSPSRSSTPSSAARCTGAGSCAASRRRSPGSASAVDTGPANSITNSLSPASKAVGDVEPVRAVLVRGPAELPAVQRHRRDRVEALGDQLLPGRCRPRPR